MHEFELPDDVNIARIQIECIYTCGEPDNNIVFGASCKAEDTYGSGALFLEPNYDFSFICSSSNFVILRGSADADQSRHERGLVSDKFEEVKIDLTAADAEPLKADEAIIQAVLENRAIVGRTRFLDESDGVVGDIYYPIKTINVRRTARWWQVDTGPVLIPDPDSDQAGGIDGLVPGYIAYSQLRHRTDAIILQPTALSQGGEEVLVNHYSRQISVRAENALFAV